MSETTRETVTTKERSNMPLAQTSIKSTVKTQATGSQYVEQFVYFTLGVLEVLLAFRFILKLAGASPSSTFVQFIYNLSSIFILPFEGIFRKAVAQGIETSSVIEPATIVALIVYGVVAWGIVELFRMLSGEVKSE